MRTAKHYTWEIKPLNTPFIKKKCSKCNGTALFYCSNNFRINANKKYLDVWLIYRCENCDTTYNLTILSRTNPQQINKDLYNRFMSNDEQLAHTYAFDAQIMADNKVVVDYTHIEYNIESSLADQKELLDIEEDIISFEIKIERNVDTKVNQLIKKCLNISANRQEKMIEGGLMSLSPEKTLLKHKIRNGICVSFDKDTLIKEIANPI